MAKKLVDQDEAARMLGVTPEQINTMRDRKELFAYRDGDAWKFKHEDIERVARERQEEGDSGLSDDDAPLELNDDLDSILLSEAELGSGDTTSSTIIGKTSDPSTAEESDIQIAGRVPAPGDSDVGLVAGDSGAGSDVKLIVGGSDIDKPPIPTSKKTPPRTSLSDLDDLPEPSGLGKSLGSSLAGSSGPVKKPDSDNLGGSDLILDDEDDDDVLVLGGGSDITLSSLDSGISLVDPKDSGLSLEEPVELGGSNELLELGEDDVVSLEEAADMDAATQLKADDDFLLTPVQGADGDESDSGSQVIALDSDDDFGGGMFAPVSPGAGMLEEEMPGQMGAATPFVTGAALATGPSLMSAPTVPEAPYTPLNILALTCCVIFLMFGGIMIYDLSRNIWSWDNPNTVPSALMESIGSSIGWFEK